MSGRADQIAALYAEQARVVQRQVGLPVVTEQKRTLSAVTESA
jgi:hypothetical protein